MKLLVLGGTLFLGRHFVEAALERGHVPTLFHRGRTAPGLFPAAERVLGDRDGGLGALDGRTFDAVVDTSGYVPRIVRESARLLAPRAACYAFVSTISVYPDTVPAGADEDHPTTPLDDPLDESLTGGRYGALKAACEREAVAAFGNRTLVVRPGLIVGPHDPTDRFTWWLRRLRRGGETLAPGDPGQPLQLVDVRDLASAMLDWIERGVTGTLNVTGPAERLTLGSALEGCRAALGGDARLAWVAESFLLAREVRPWLELPLWVPAASHGFLDVSISRALAHGMRFRALSDTARDTLAWDDATPAAARPPKSGLQFPVGLDAEKERELLEAWRRRT